MKKPNNSIAVANAFLDLAKKSEEEITHMKLQKLIYIAHGFNLSNFDFPLIDEQVEAWRYGPVIRSVYDEFKSYGHDPITKYGGILDVIETFKRGKIVENIPIT